MLEVTNEDKGAKRGALSKLTKSKLKSKKRGTEEADETSSSADGDGTSFVPYFR